MKFRAERKNSNEKTPIDNELTNDDQQDDQWLKDNIHTMKVYLIAVLEMIFFKKSNLFSLHLLENVSAKNEIEFKKQK